MKKTLFYTLLVLGIVALMTSCFGLIPSTKKMVVDENVPGEQSVLVTFSNRTEKGYFFMKQWNNKDITDINKNTKSNDNFKLTVPAGNTSFTFDVRYTFSNRYSSTTYPIEDIELRYNLEPGKEYQINGDARSLGFFKGHELFVEIYDVTGKKTFLKEWKLGETK